MIKMVYPVEQATFTTRASRPRLALDGFLAASLAALTIARYWGSLELWWTLDDPFHIHHLLNHRTGEYFNSPKLWHELPFQLFTPLQFLSYKVDMRFFGLDAEKFYLHQLAALAIASSGLYLVLRLWWQPFYSAAATVMTTMGASVASWATQLMVRHYVEGSIFYLTCTALFVLSLRRQSRALRFASALLLFLAMASKEVFVPGVAMLLALPEGTLGKRLRLIWPHILATAAYFVWRWVMLGTVLGGYGWAIRRGEWALVLASLPVRLLAVMRGTAISATLAVVIILIGVFYSLTDKRRRVAVFVGVAAAITPLIPVAKVVEPRFAVISWALIVISAVSGFRMLATRIHWRWLSPSLVMLGAVFVCFDGHKVLQSRVVDARRMSSEARAFVQMEPDGALRNPIVPPAAMGEFRWLKENYLNKPPGSGWFYDDSHLCAGPLPKNVYEYQESSGRPVRIDASKTVSSSCARIREAVLTVELEQDNGVLQWTLGPYEGGVFSFTLGNGSQRFEVPPRGAFQVGRTGEMRFKIRYDHPAGWVTYSDELVIDLDDDGKTSWRRPCEHRRGRPPSSQNNSSTQVYAAQCASAILHSQFSGEAASAVTDFAQGVIHSINETQPTRNRDAVNSRSASPGKA
ncbi:MAG TPA: hypothetical protein VNM92_03360 [Thermoanaerobaculia bacterium]|nr:hypothetical protein [Thermoanaerobaculia bacterium]